MSWQYLGFLQRSMLKLQQTENKNVQVRSTTPLPLNISNLVFSFFFFFSIFDRIKLVGTKDSPLAEYNFLNCFYSFSVQKQKKEKKIKKRKRRKQKHLNNMFVTINWCWLSWHFQKQKISTVLFPFFIFNKCICVLKSFENEYNVKCSS